MTSVCGCSHTVPPAVVRIVRNTGGSADPAPGERVAVFDTGAPSSWNEPAHVTEPAGSSAATHVTVNTARTQAQASANCDTGRIGTCDYNGSKCSACVNDGGLHIAGLYMAPAALWHSESAGNGLRLFRTPRLVTADLEFRRGDGIGLQRALRIAPLDAGDLAKWSLLTENREDAIQSLNKAVRSNPWYAWAWIQLGLAAEEAGQTGIAERDLLNAAAVDHGFDPGWALGNYYFRRGDFEHFWQWTRAVLSIDGAESLPALRLAWRVAPDVRTILDRAVPDTNAARRKLLIFFIGEHPLGNDFPVLSSLFSAATPDDLPALDSFARTLVNGGEVDHAVELWNSLCRLRFLPFDGIHAESDTLLTNAAFISPPSSRVFDWHFTPAEGIAAENHAPGAFALVLSGSEPEHWRILSQLVPVQPGKRYALKFHTRLSSGGPARGLSWKIIDGTTPGKALINSSAADEGELQVSSSTSLVTIAFDYDRPRGETRLTGQATVTGLALRSLDTQ